MRGIHLGAARLVPLQCSWAQSDPVWAPVVPQEEQGKMHDMFLYSRAHLLAEAPLPAPEALPECPLDREHFSPPCCGLHC